MFYAKAYRRDWAVRLVAGPFEQWQEAADRAARLRPLYPNSAVEVTERDFAGLRTAEGRRHVAAMLRQHAERIGARVEWDAETDDIDIRLPTLRANIWLADIPASPMPIISWVAGYGLRLSSLIPGAWLERGEPHRKATSMPETWTQLYDALEIGLCAGVDGGAFN